MNRKTLEEVRAGWRDRFNNRSLTDAPEKPNFMAKSNGDGTAEILIYDEIGFWGINARDFAKTMASIDAEKITVRINSPGGDVFDGLAIHNTLKNHKAEINVRIEGLAASAASFIALAGDTITMAEHSFLMIHKAWGITVGNSDDHTSTAAVLDKIDGDLAEIYAAKTGKTKEDMVAAMKDETWFTSAEAKDFGLIDSIDTPAEEDGEPTKKAMDTNRINAMRRRLRLAEVDL